MPSKTTYLELTLPSFQEFIDSWHTPVNENMEDIDAWAQDLHDSLVSPGSNTGTWASLRGDFGNLADRLAVSILADGSINLSANPDMLGLASSATKGTEGSPDDDPRGRFDRSDFEIYNARQAVAGGRFVPITAGGPSAGYPEEELDAGIAIRMADFGKNATHVISSPAWPSSDGHVSGGDGNLISVTAANRVFKLNAAVSPAVFNMDGYHFRIREDILVDYNALAPSLLNWMWIYVSRLETDYGDINILYSQTGGYAAKDLRILQNGTGGSGVAATSVLLDGGATALFNSSTIGEVEAGDILVIDDTTAAGKYVIESVDSDEQLTIRGTFKNDFGGADWHIQDDLHPHVGVIEGTADEEAFPTFVAGRSYIGRVKDQGAGFPPVNPTNYAKGGVFDSGWSGAPIDIGDFPQAFTHDLGVQPSRVEIFFRATATSEEYPALVRRPVVAEVVITAAIPIADDINYATLLFPSVYWFATTETIEIRVLNALPDNLAPVGAALFTDNAGVDHGDAGDTVEMRVVVTR